MDKCPYRSCKPGDIRDRGLYSTLPFPHCANSVLYVDYTETPKFGGYDFALLVTCGLTRFTRVFPCTKHITGEETIKILLEEWFCVLKPVRTPVAILGSLGVCIYVPASHHWLISYSPIHLI